MLLVSEWKNLACHPAGSVFQKGDMGMYPSSHGHIPGVSSENCQKKKEKRDEPETEKQMRV